MMKPLVNQRSKIWIVEDDTSACFLFEEALSTRFDVEFTKSAEEFQALVRNNQTLPHLVIADLRLPDNYLLDILADRKNLWPLPDNVPIIVVSGVDDAEVVRKCFEYGAVDYITKPFSHNELLVKIERMLAGGSNQPFYLDHISLCVRLPDRRISEPLTSKEFQIMALLAEGKEAGVKRRHFIQAIWGDAKVSDKVFDVHLFNLRRKLSALGISIRFANPNRYFVETEA